MPSRSNVRFLIRMATSEDVSKAPSLGDEGAVYVCMYVYMYAGVDQREYVDKTTNIQTNLVLLLSTVYPVAPVEELPRSG